MKKLRNKKTGEVFDALIREKGGGGSYSLIVCDVKAYEQSKSTLDATHFVLDEYDSLAELNEDWEDYEPKEPLIKDERIRRAVRAWAEANDIERVWHEYSSCWLRGNGLVIAMENEVTELGQGNYSIDELCGEEEE